jgi:4-hydroxy 2-oxovalerate aldolase
VKKILLSSIKTEGKSDEYIVEFERAIKRGWDHFDNAVICCLRLLKQLEVKSVFISGFDGFKQTYNESYADESLPTINPGKKWDELNEEIKDMFKDVKKSASDMHITFLTESVYE